MDRGFHVQVEDVEFFLEEKEEQKGKGKRWQDEKRENKEGK